MTQRRFSLRRIAAILVKEVIQLRRDRLTFAMILGIPTMQLLLFGFAINSDPKHLPAAIAISDPGTFSDSIVAALSNSGYYDIRLATNSPEKARRLLAEGDVSFVVEIPANFSRDIVRGAQGESLAQVVDEQQPRLDLVAAGDSVDRELDLHDWIRPPLNR